MKQCPCCGSGRTHEDANWFRCYDCGYEYGKRDRDREKKMRREKERQEQERSR